MIKKLRRREADGMADIRITKSRLKTHWVYNWYKYLIVCAALFFCMNTLFTMTEHRAAENRKLEMYLCSGWADTDRLHDALWPRLAEACPEQEELLILNIDLVSDMDYTGIMRFTTYVGAGQGDMMLLPLEEAARMADGEAETVFVDLTPFVEDGTLDVSGLNLTAGMLKKSDGTPGLFGIPGDALPGLDEYMRQDAPGVLCLVDYGKNIETAVRLMDIMTKMFK